jgi:hypothetical protein
VQKGACCYRRSNKARLDPSAATAVLQFRLNEFLLINHQKNIDPMVLGPTEQQRSDNEEQSLLFEFTLPQTGGKVVDGMGKVRIGAGAYNCDGTYSFYTDSAAPPTGGDMTPGRWYSGVMNATVTAAKTDKDRVKPNFADQLPIQNKATYTPYLGAGPDYAIDWEGESQGFDIIDMPTGDANIDCVGTRADSTTWKAGGHTKAYGRVDLNAADIIDSLGVNFSQLMAFGSVANAPDATKLPRCDPGSSGCAWVRLPDSLCPVTDDEKKNWGCHLGYDGNADNSSVTMNCTSSAPAAGSVDGTANTPEGQCCDPKGSGAGGLPACNAWLQINEFVSAAAPITDADVGKVQQSCHGKGD